MSKFDELHQHLQECVDSNDSDLIVTTNGVTFNVFENAYTLSVDAKRERDRLVEENKRLREALIGMTERHCDLINSGDAGNWNPEEDQPVISARLALSCSGENK